MGALVDAMQCKCPDDVSVFTKYRYLFLAEKKSYFIFPFCLSWTTDVNSSL